MAGKFALLFSASQEWMDAASAANVTPAGLARAGVGSRQEGFSHGVLSWWSACGWLTACCGQSSPQNLQVGVGWLR